MIAKKLSKILFTLILSACSLSCPLYGVTQQAKTAPAAMPDLNISPDQMQKMDVMMNEMQNFYENLSAAEKAQFEKELAAEVEKEQKKLESMTPDAQKQYIETAFSAFDDLDINDLIEQLGQEESDGQQTTNNNDKPTEKDIAKNKEAEKTENKKKIKDTLDLINNIIKILNSLTEKLNSIKPSVQHLVDGLIKKGSISKWAGQKSSWNLFSKDLQTMKQRLEKLKQEDPSTGKYYYLDDIKTVEKLYGNLQTLSKIKNFEPQVIVNAAGKMQNEASKSALVNLINFLSLQTEIIIKNADEIINKFTKEAAPKIKKQEEDKAKKAERKTYSRGKTTSAGQYDKEEDSYKYGVDTIQDYYGPTYSSSNSYGSSYGDRPDSYSSSLAQASTPSSIDSKTPSAQSSTGDQKKNDNAVTAAAPLDQKKSPDGQKIVGDSQNKALEIKYPRIKTGLGRISIAMEDFEDSFDFLKMNKNWTDNKLIDYLTKSTTDDDFFEKRINDTVEKLNKVNESVTQLVDTVNIYTPLDANVKKTCINEALEILKVDKEIGDDISKKLKSITEQYNAGFIKLPKKIELYNKLSELKNLASIKNNLSEIK